MELVELADASCMDPADDSVGKKLSTLALVASAGGLA